MEHLPSRQTGQCEIEGRCIQSPGYPESYPTSWWQGGYECRVDVPAYSALKVADLGSDWPSDLSFFIYDRVYDSNNLKVGQVLVHDQHRESGRSSLIWQPGRRRRRNGEFPAWKFCVVRPASCPDGSLLVPVARGDCPSSLAFLATCDEALPGDLCEGGPNGEPRCRTRTDLQNCLFLSAQNHRSVYRKGMPRTSSTMTSATTTSFTASYVAPTNGSWQYSGPCQVSGACLRSPNFPSKYGVNERCEAFLPDFSVVTVRSFATETFKDFLTIDGQWYSGPQWFGPQSFVIRSGISWASDGVGNGKGWELCVEGSPSCVDGLPLIPVSVKDCPAGTEALPNCHVASPGDLCEGDGTCGTRVDIDNCYDRSYSYPPTRDVYLKAHGTTRTSTTRTSTSTNTLTSSTTTLTTHTGTNFAGSWQYSGPCQVSGACLRSPNFPSKYGVNERCEAFLPDFSVVTVRSFATETFKDFLTIDGQWYSGPQWFGPQSFVIRSGISWASDGVGNGKGWELCVEGSPSCVDGLPLIPVSVKDCPAGTEALPNCHAASPGDLCEGDGTCGTRVDIDNCYDRSYSYPPTRDVYLKAHGTTRTSTTRTSTSTNTLTLTSSTTTLPWLRSGVWHHVGPCTVVEDCAQGSPRSEEMQPCFFQIPKGSIVQAPPM